MKRQCLLPMLGVCAITLACSDASRESTTAAPAGGAARTSAKVACDDAAGLTLPPGFCATVFADNVGHARHLAVAANGDVYVNTVTYPPDKMTSPAGGYLVALRDADRDGRAEVVARFGAPFQAGKPGGGTGLAIYGDGLFVEVDDRIVRYSLASAAPVPAGAEPEVVLTGLPKTGDHGMHPFTISANGVLFVNSGSASNACQVKNRARQSSGQKPCAELETRAGIWKYDANARAQTFAADGRFATGMRNTVALAVQDGILYAAIHGRDQLFDNWPKLYTEAQQNELPAEVLVRVDQSDDHGWPYCYFDAAQNRHVLAPEYGGDGGHAQGNCTGKKMPNVTFPAHWAPEAMAFYNASVFPAKYRDGAFVSFHGSWNRKPAQAGFLIAFVPFVSGPAGRYEEFATGFAGAQPIADPKSAPHRPMGLAVGPDGALYVSDDVAGRIWRITYGGGAQ